MMKKLVLATPDLLPNILGIVYPKIEAACARSVGKYNGSDIVKCLIDRSMQLWVVFDDMDSEVNAIVITEISQFPRIKLLRLLCCTGENSEQWVHLLKDIEDFGKIHGCEGFQAECRPGWEKVLKNLGYKKEHVILNKAAK
jgi:hypothetical protein